MNPRPPRHAAALGKLASPRLGRVFDRNRLFELLDSGSSAPLLTAPADSTPSLLLVDDEVNNLQALRRVADDVGLPARVAVRVNPDFELKSSGMKMSGGPKQFGIDAEQVPAVLQEIGPLGLGFEGFHIFSGSQNLRAEAIIEAQRNTVDLARRLADDAPAPIQMLTLGGGFGIP